MAGTTSPIISNLLSSLKRLSQFMPTFSSLAASSSSSIAQEDVTTAKVNSNQKRLMEDLSRLSRMLRRIQAALHDAEEREINEKAIQLWLSELREVAYDAEDVLDQYDYQIIKIQLEGMTTVAEAEPSLKRKRVDDDDFYGYQVPLPPPHSIKIPISYDMAMRITEIIKKFDEIANDRKALMLKEEDAPRRPYFNDVMKRPPSSSHQDESNIFGREGDKKKIIELLMSHSEKENIVIPIVGLGGVGKTTFARLIYNDPVVCQHFFPKVWVCVSEEFDVLRITKEIVSSIIKSSIHDDKNNSNDLHCILMEALSEKRFLLILDDVWNERPDMWEALHAPFSGIGMGKIIVTTRSKSVARIMQTVLPHELGCLDEEKSWLLFQRHAFSGLKPGQQQNFEQIGRGITKKCGGLPLALKAIGRFLQCEVKEQIWMDVLNNNLWELEETKSLILPALMISYNHLPAYFKPCFLYSSLFPKNYYFNKVELTQMWIAQGYIQLTQRKRLLEDIAFEFFEELVRRSFFQYSKYNEAFTLHDMVHDLAQSITKNEIFSSLEFDKLKNNPKDMNHIFIQGGKINQILLHGAIRTLYTDQNIFSMESFSPLVCLRVLRFHAPNFECSIQFVDLIGNMRQLRYLSIHARLIQMTENSLGSLYKLRVLILKSPHINMLPAFGNFLNLRHLTIHSMYKKLMPKSSSELRNLLTFDFDSEFHFNEKKSELFASKYELRSDGQYSNIAWLKHLTNLRGNLQIYGLGNVINHEDAKRANLQSKPYIESLSFAWRNSNYYGCRRNDEAVLEGLQPHKNLKELTMDGYNSRNFPSWFSNPCISNLTKIRLRNFDINVKCMYHPLSKLPSLTSLIMSLNSSIIRMWQGDFWDYNGDSFDFKWQSLVNYGDFSSLKSLVITFCDNLHYILTLPSNLEEFSVLGCKRLEYIELPYSLGHLSKLQKVKIYVCPELKSVINLNNLLGTLKVMKLFKCDLLMADPHEVFDHSFGRVSLEKCMAVVIQCPKMREWCQQHGFTSHPVEIPKFRRKSRSNPCIRRASVKIPRFLLKSRKSTIKATTNGGVWFRLPIRELHAQASSPSASPIRKPQLSSEADPVSSSHSSLPQAAKLSISFPVDQAELLCKPQETRTITSSDSYFPAFVSLCKPLLSPTNASSPIYLVYTERGREKELSTSLPSSSYQRALAKISSSHPRTLSTCSRKHPTIPHSDFNRPPELIPSPTGAAKLTIPPTASADRF